MPRDRSAERDAITRAATEAGVDPSYALAVAERESNFDPRARSSRSIAGVFQMRGDLRAKYGAGDSADPYAQAKGWTASLGDIRKDMASRLGRDPSDPEAYLGHHFGAPRAARMLKMDPSTPVDAVFTPQEMAGNPHFARAGTVGKLNGSVVGDIEQRMARFGGGDRSAAEPADLSSLGDLVESPEPAPSTRQASMEQNDLSSLGQPVQSPTSTPLPAAPVAPQDLSTIGTPVQ